MLFQLNPSSSMIINRARLTSAAGETRDRVNDTNARRSSLVRLKTDCMLHIVLLKSMLHNTSQLPRTEAFRRGPRELGYVEGKNILIEYRHAEVKYDRLPVLAAELVRLKVDVIVTGGWPATPAAEAATFPSPLCMANDPAPARHALH